MDYKNIAKVAKEFNCLLCDYICFKQSDYNKHLLTAKHMKITNDSDKSQKIAIYKCICGNEYKHRQNLHRHKKSCTVISDANYKNKIIEDLLKQNNELKEIILEQKEVFIEQIEYNKQLLGIAKEQKELAMEQKEIALDQKYLAMDQKTLVQEQVEEQQEHNRKVLELAQETKDLAQEQKELTIEQAEQTKQLMDQIKEKGIGGNITNNTTNNIFNLNNFLTVTCKDAMDITELFKMVEEYAIPNRLIEFFEYGTHSNGMNKVIDEILNKIPINKRPIHCSDLKREVLHIKSDNLWEKEDDTGARLLEISFINEIKGRVFNETLRWKNAVLNPNSDKDDDKFNRVLIQLIGPSSSSDAYKREREKMKGYIAKKTLISKE